MVVNWRIYNESLVRRSEIVLSFDVIDNWNNEFSKMNDGKEVHYADVQIFWFDYLVWESLMSHKLFLPYMKGLNYI